VPAAAAAPAAGPPGGESLDPNRGMGFGGLSTGGGLGTGSYLDVKNFCCPDYLVTMLQLIQSNWRAQQQVVGEAMVVFRIQRDGRLTEIELERSVLAEDHGPRPIDGDGGCLHGLQPPRARGSSEDPAAQRRASSR